MYNFVYISKNNQKVRSAFQEINEMLNELHKMIKKQFTFQTEVIGSYRRNMITYDEKSNIGFDFDFNIIVNNNAHKYSAKQIKEVILLETFKKLAPNYGFDKIENSTRVITLKKINKKKSKIIYSCDFAIVDNYTDEDGNNNQDYIRFNKKSNTYQWLPQTDGFFNFTDKFDWLLNNEGDTPEMRDTLKKELRDLYLEKKNNNNDKNLHSRHLLAQAVHEMCQYYGYYQ